MDLELQPMVNLHMLLVFITVGKRPANKRGGTSLLFSVHVLSLL
jgi:hypothetical protein